MANATKISSDRLMNQFIWMTEQTQTARSETHVTLSTMQKGWSSTDRCQNTGGRNNISATRIQHTLFHA